jgi:orotidine-5'-phosphate decarboxylase
MKNPIIVALDLPDPGKAFALAKMVAPFVGAFKIGSELFTAAGPEMVKQIRGIGGTVFLDLKFHDIPNTVAKSVANAVRLDVQMLTVHTSGGFDMMAAAEKSAVATAAFLEKTPPLVLGVTVLTSMDRGTLSEIGCPTDVPEQVTRLAALAVKAGLPGLVCSPLEVRDLRKTLPPKFQLITPGIRSKSAKLNDQKRTMTPMEAIQAGASWIVVGRPIYAAEDPIRAVEQILASITTP